MRILEDLKLFRLFKFRCVLCMRKAVCIHEIVPKSRNPDWKEEENRVPLCAKCHDTIHREGTATWEDRLKSLRQVRLIWMKTRT